MAYPITNALAPAYQDPLQRLKLGIPDDYQAGPLQKAQEAQGNVPIVNNDLLMNGHDSGFYRALSAFQQHFGGGGSNG